MKAIRQTIDLSAYPDLVVVYLGMTVNMLTASKRYLASNQKLSALWPLGLTVCFFTTSLVAVMTEATAPKT